MSSSGGEFGSVLGAKKAAASDERSRGKDWIRPFPAAAAAAAAGATTHLHARSETKTSPLRQKHCRAAALAASDERETEASARSRRGAWSRPRAKRLSEEEIEDKSDERLRW